MSRSAPCCANPLCRVTIPRWKRICDDCWKLLPRSHRAALIEAKSGNNFVSLDRLAIEAGAWLREHNPAAEAARRLGEGA